MDLSCIAKVGPDRAQTCRARAKFYAEPYCNSGTKVPLCGTHANRWKRAGHEITPIQSSASCDSEKG